MRGADHRERQQQRHDRDNQRYLQVQITVLFVLMPLNVDVVFIPSLEDGSL